MKRIFSRRRARRGESLVEILIAIAVVALGCLLIATMYSASMDMNIDASKMDDEFYDALSETEQLLDGESTETGKAVVTEKEGGSYDVTVELYGDEKNGAYKRQGS